LREGVARVSETEAVMPQQGANAAGDVVGQMVLTAIALEFVE
jgi:hypothetical protein